MAKNSMVQLNNIWKDHSITADLKIKLLKCLVWPVMLYGCEAWTMKKEDERRVEAAELWFYRRLLKVKLTDRRSNESILNELGTTRKLLMLIQRRKLKYVGHAIRNERTELMSTVLQDKVKGKRHRGRHLHHLLETSQTSVARNFRRWSDLAKVESAGGNL